MASVTADDTAGVLVLLLPLVLLVVAGDEDDDATAADDDGGGNEGKGLLLPAKVRLKNSANFRGSPDNGASLLLLLLADVDDEVVDELPAAVGGAPAMPSNDFNISINFLISSESYATNVDE